MKINARQWAGFWVCGTDRRPASREERRAAVEADGDDRRRAMSAAEAGVEDPAAAVADWIERGD